MLFLPLVTFAIAAFIVLIFDKWRNFFKLSAKIPYIEGHHFFISGILMMAGKNSYEFFQSLFVLNEHKIKTSPAKTWLGPELILFISDPVQAKKILSSTECLGKPSFFNIKSMSKGMIFGEINYWQSHRRILNPSFKMKILKTFLPVFNEKANKFIQNLASKCDGKEFNAYYQTSAFFLETAFLTLMIHDIDIIGRDDHKKEELVENVDELLQIELRRMKNPLYSFDFIYNHTKDFEYREKNFPNQVVTATAMKVFEDRKLNGNNFYYGDESQNPVEVLFDSRHALSDEEIKHEIFTILFAAQDTSSTAVATNLVLLGMFKDVQEKLFAEIEEHCPHHFDLIDTRVLNNMKYLECVVNESMRLFPVVPLLVRHVAKEFRLDDNYVLPEGANIFIRNFTILRDKTIWGEDADVFKPERFEKEQMKNVPKYCFLPFSDGPRICLGWQYAMIFMKIALLHIVKTYEIDTSLKYEDIKLKVMPLVKMNSYNISLKKRIID